MSPHHPAHDSLAQLNDVAQHVLGLLWGTLLGLATGFVAARLMRRSNLHWSWAACVFVLAVVARRSFAPTGPVLAVGALFAAARSRRWQRRDLESGLDLAAGARVRRTPWAAARRLAWTVRVWRGAGSHMAPRGEVLLGHDELWRSVAVPLASGGGGSHTLVVGATGSGKTVTQCRMAMGAIASGMGAVVVDPKGDRELRTALIAAAHQAQRPFKEWTPTGPCIYNPFARGSETEISDKALAGERFTEPHYLRQAQRYLGHAVRALRGAGAQVSLGRLVELLDPVCLEQLARRLGTEQANLTYAYLDSLGSRQRSDLAGVRDRLAVLAESDAGRWLDPEAACGEQFELLECVRAGAIVLFALQADSRPLLSQMLAAAVVQDLQTVVAASQERPVRTLVLIDEFSAIAAEQVVRLFARARSAGISLVLGTQEISDLRPAMRPSLLEQVMGNLSLLIAHRQVVPASAEMVASLAGRRGAWRVTHNSGGSCTRTRVPRAQLEPEQVMGLAPGWAAVLPLGLGQDARITRVLRTRPAVDSASEAAQANS